MFVGNQIWDFVNAAAIASQRFGLWISEAPGHHAKHLEVRIISSHPSPEIQSQNRFPGPPTLVNTMTENQPPATNGDAAGVPFYEKQRQMLHSMINKKRLLERSLANIEDNIAKKESEYLEDTPNGNIITGFEGYTKGTTAAPGQRRRGAIQETNKVFSRSSVTYNLNAVSVPLALVGRGRLMFCD